MLRSQSARLSSIAKDILALPQQPISDMRQTLLGLEGTAGRIYFSALSALLPPKAMGTYGTGPDLDAPFVQSKPEVCRFPGVGQRSVGTFAEKGYYFHLAARQKD